MKMNRKVLATAVTLALGTISAAAFADAIPTNGLYFTAIDSVNNTSIVVNLGVTVPTIRANGSTAYALTGTGLAGLQTWLSTANIGGVTWTVLGANNDGTANDPVPSVNYGGISTSTNIATTPADWGTFGGLDNYVSSTPTYLNTVNPFLAGSVNSYSTSGNSALSFVGQYTIGFNGLGTVGSSMGFYNFFASQDPNDSPYFVGQYSTLPGTWSLTYVGGQASLAYTGGGAPPAVPVPAAIWLLGSGLLGLVGIGRRKAAAMTGAVAA